MPRPYKQAVACACGEGVPQGMVEQGLERFPPATPPTGTVGLIHPIARLFARASRARRARHPAWPWLGAGLWVMGCQALPAASSKPDPSAAEVSVTTGAPGGAAGPGDAGPAGPPFVEVAGGPCKDVPEVIDAEDATFLVSRTLARRAEPGRAELEEVAGLPSPRGATLGFALHPFILHVQRPNGVPPSTLDALGYFLLDPRQHTFSRIETARFGNEGAFGDYPTALPVPGGTVVVTFTRGTKRPTDSGYGVPAGDGSEAQMVSGDGVVRPFPSWPNVLFTDPVFAVDGVIWAMAIRPGMPGNFVLRVPLAGPPKYFPVPGTQGCRGEDRIPYPGKLVEEGAGAEEVTVDVDEYPSCVTKGAGGRYRLHTPDARWHRQPESNVGGPAPTAGRPKPGPVQIGGATLRIDGTRALITGPGPEGERDADPDPPGDLAQKRSLVMTAGGREVWLETRWKTHCRLGRYRTW